MKMKIYFTASIYYRDILRKEYISIIEAIKKSGNKIIMSYDVLEQDLGNVLNQTIEDSMKFYQKWERSIKDVIL